MIAVLILAFGAGNWYAQRMAHKQALPDELILLQEDTDIIQKESAAPELDIVVFVSGAVVNPGIYTLPARSRLYEALEKAGGLLPEAEAGQIPMARIIEDEETIYIPKAGEEGAGEEVLPSLPDNSSAKININKAAASELETLNGIGPALAQRIIDYRNKQGPFKDINEIKNVSGIGDKKFEAIKDSISVK